MSKKKKGEGRVVITNVRVTKETHREIQVASEILDKTNSEIISMALRALLPNLPDEVSRFDEMQRKAKERAETALKEQAEN